MCLLPQLAQGGGHSVACWVGPGRQEGHRRNVSYAWLLAPLVPGCTGVDTAPGPHLTPLPLQEGARVFGALGPIGPSSPGLTLGGLAVNEHRLSNKLLAWSGVLEWQEVRGCAVWEWEAGRGTWPP